MIYKDLSSCGCVERIGRHGCLVLGFAILVGGWSSSPLSVASALANISRANISRANIFPEPSENEPASNEPDSGSVGGTSDDSSGVTVLYFTQQDCPPCRQMQPMLEHLIGRGFPVQVVDALAHPNLVQQFRVQSTPTFVLLKDGQELKRHNGVLSSYQINSLLIDAGYATDQNVLTKPNALSPIVNFFDRLRPVARSDGRGQGLAKLGPSNVDPTATIAWTDLTAAERQALQATGRLKIAYQDRGQSVTDYGTATVIHRQGADILLLTCGHVFRDSQGQGDIRVELDFSDGQPKEIVPGRLLLFDAGAPDVALVAARTNLPIAPMPIAGSDYRPARGAPAFSVGCDQGAPATVRRGDHLAIVRCGAVQIPGQPTDDRMARKFAVHGRPVVGRSGGGLFTSEGNLIGVCNAAVVGSNEGRYSAIDNVHTLLGQTNLARFFAQPPYEGPGSVRTSEILLASDTGATESPRRSAGQRYLPIIEDPSTDIPRSNGLSPFAGSRQLQALGQSMR
ncbi:MAG: trypsin-like peptidase domain-containing protein [Pirellulaceae bacterium]|nr:trypsin-like peptidase domain-containing protein [Pirellulaceae bacterium]